MLIGMTIAPVGRDDDKTFERRLRRVAEAGNRSRGAGTNAGDATEQGHDAQPRSRKVSENGDGVGGMETAHGYTPEQLRHAAECPTNEPYFPMFWDRCAPLVLGCFGAVHAGGC